MATTTNYSWTTPDDTALVKDGASAIRALGTAIDTSMNTALGTKKAGMVLLNTTSFSAVSSQSINSVFSATYDVYKIVLVATASAGNTMTMRLRVGGVDNSTASSYVGQYVQGVSASPSSGQDTDNLWYIGNFNTNRSMASLDIAQPFVAATTTIVGNIGRTDRVRTFFGNHNQSTSYDGFSIIPDGGSTITGYVQIFGYNK